MPKGPQGQRRPADPIAWAVHVGRIATGEIEETYEAPGGQNPAPGSQRAREGGTARVAKLTPERRREIAAAGADTRQNTEAPSAVLHTGPSGGGDRG